MSIFGEYEINNLTDVYNYFIDNEFNLRTYLLMILSLLDKRITRSESKRFPCSCCFIRRCNYTIISSYMFKNYIIEDLWYNCQRIKNRQKYNQGICVSVYKFYSFIYFIY